MPRLRTKPPVFRSKKTQTVTNSVKRDISNVSLQGRDTSNENFFLDSYKTGFKSTQQLALDFSQFKNHTFFSPARAKVDVALFKSINEFPFTGSITEIDKFLVGLTGFERYVFDSIPRNTGYLFFSGTQVGETSGGTYIDVSPISGHEFPNSPGATAEQALVINGSPFEIELHLYVPEVFNDNQIVVQRLQDEAGYTLALSSSLSSNECKIVFLVSSASDSYLVASGTLEKGNFSHVRACLFNTDNGKQSFVYLDDKLISSSSDTQDFGSLVFDTSSLIIGSGSRHTILDYDFLPRQTLSGAIDEFRFFSKQRDEETISKFSKSQMFATGGLEAYFRFDEPAGNYSMKDIVLDHSGRCLHSRILNYIPVLRVTSSISVPLYSQNPYFSPVLYPDFVPFSSRITDLISSASSYDNENPNIVTNLVPIHYLVESANAAGLQSVSSGIGVFPSIVDLPGTGEIPETSALLRTLIMMSIPLDEIKQFIDSMSTLLAVELGNEEKLNSQMIKFAGDYFGIDLPNFFSKSTTNQFSFGEDVSETGYFEYTLRALRDDLWRRILANMPYVNSSKGTKSAVRSIFLSSGIIPENFFVIREFGQSGETRLADLRDYSVEVSSMLDFSSSLGTPTGQFIPPGVRTNSPRIISPFLSASRVETGIPRITGNFVSKDLFPPHGISNNPNDGLLTSGSFSIEASVIFDRKIKHDITQSIFRIITTGSASPNDFLVGNLFYRSESPETGSLVFATRPTFEPGTVAPEPLVMSIPGINLFDGERWTVGIEKIRGDVIGTTSSSYTLRCARQVGDYLDFFSTSSLYSDYSVLPNQSVFLNRSSLYNASGSYLIIGSQSITPNTRFLNGYESYLGTKFSGKISGIKFFSSKIGNKSFIEHARNFASIGTDNPEIGLGFDLVQTGAFERLRIDASCDQATTGTDSIGNILIFDFSQNGLHLSGSGFPPSRSVVSPQTLNINRISPRFDLQQVANKVRPRGLDVPNKSDPGYVVTGPAYEIYDVNEIVDDIRFAIEHSIVKALNEDMISTIGDTQYLDNSLGRPEYMFSDSYPDLDHFSNVYFNRLTGKLDIMKTYEVFRWVDVALTDLVESILPKRTKFMGINYIIESHLIERAKLRYRSEDMFILSQIDPLYEKSAILRKESLLTTNLSGIIKRL
jgi:hypothetical protein